VGRESPTTRSLQSLRERGLEAVVVERWNPHARIRQDLFGWIDILALDPITGRLHGVQTTTAGASARVAKVRAWPHLRVWLEAGNSATVHSWVKRNDRQPGRRKVWSLREIQVEP